MIECDNCGAEYERLGQHIAMGECGYPHISDYQTSLLKGALMGDGCVSNRNGENPYFVIEMVNERFLQWFQTELSQIMYSVKKAKTAKQSYESTKRTLDHNLNQDNFQDTYRTQTMRHPWFSKLAEWYSTGEKRYPDDLELNKTIAKMWYVTDGGLRVKSGDNHNSNVTISCDNESDRVEYIQNLFSRVGFEPHFNDGNIVFTVSESQEFLDWIGDPVPGFNYKWCEFIDQSKPWHDKERLYDLYVNSDLSLSAVANELGCSDRTVAKWLRKHNLPVRNHAGEFE